MTTLPIGRKLLLGLVGSGIQRSLSPALHEEEGRHHGLRTHYQLIDLKEARVGLDSLPGLLDAMRVMGFAGFNVTHPCKQAVVPLLDALSDEARAMGAVNTVVLRDGRLIGHNTDGPGWSWGLRRALPDANLGRVVILGAGGAGSAIAHAALALGAGQLIVVDQDFQRAETLARRLGTKGNAERDVAKALAGADGLVHATPVGMEKSPGLPLAQELLRPDLWVSEIVYVPLETALLKAARRAGCRTMDGGNMNVGQAVRAFKLFTGIEPDAERMDRHFRGLQREKEGAPT
jgi:shikimate dehydrogenase